MFLVQVTEADSDCPVAATGPEPLANDASLRSVLDGFKDCFPSELPAQLPPERNVCHTGIILVPFPSKTMSPLLHARAIVSAHLNWLNYKGRLLICCKWATYSPAVVLMVTQCYQEACA